MRSLPSTTCLLATRDRNCRVRVVSDNLRMGILFFVLSIGLFGVVEGQLCQCRIRWYNGTLCANFPTSNSLADSEGKGLNCVNLPSPVGTVSYQVNDQQCGGSTLRIFNVADCAGQAERIVTAFDGACMPISDLSLGVSCSTPPPPAAPAVPAVPVVPPAVPVAPEEEEEPEPPVSTAVPTSNPSIFIYVSPQGPFPPGWQYSSSTNISINTGGGGGAAGGAWSGIKTKKLPSWIAFPIVIGAALCLFCCLFCVCCYLCRRSRRLKKQRMAASYGGGSYMSDGSPSYDLYAVQTAGYTAPVGYMQSGHAMQTIQKPLSPTVAYPNDPHPVPVNKFPNAAGFATTGGNHHHSHHHRSHHTHHSGHGHQSYPAHNAYSSHTEHVQHTHPAGFLRDDLSDDSGDRSPRHRV